MNNDIKAKFEKVIQENNKNIKKRRARENAFFKEESDLIEEIILDCKASPLAYANRINQKRDTNYYSHDIVEILERIKIFTVDEREELANWANEIIACFKQAIEGNKESFIEFDKSRKQFSKSRKWDSNFYNKVLAIAIYSKVDGFKDCEYKDNFYSFGNVLAKYHFYDIVDCVAENYGYPQLYRKKTSKSNVKDARIEKLEDKLERTEQMLVDLQDEFDEQLEESKDIEKMKFFSNLNSDKYGKILDELMQNQRGVNKLRRENAEIPIELNGVLIVFKKLVQFIKDSDIEPILKMGSVKNVRYKDICNFNYEGTAFEGDEEKKVKVISPGWIYKAKKIRIARPFVKEVNSDGR